jgi:hypothetical protein
MLCSLLDIANILEEERGKRRGRGGERIRNVLVSFSVTTV